MEQSLRHSDSTNDDDDSFAPTIGGASGLIVREGEVLVIRRGGSPYQHHWSLPSGGVRRGERLRDAVRREVREETGLDVEVGLVAGYREKLLPDGHVVVPAFHCTVVGGTVRAGDDAAAIEWVDPRDLAERPTVPALADVLRDAGLLP